MVIRLYWKLQTMFSFLCLAFMLKRHATMMTITLFIILKFFVVCHIINSLKVKVIKPKMVKYGSTYGKKRREHRKWFITL